MHLYISIIRNWLIDVVTSYEGALVVWVHGGLFSALEGRTELWKVTEGDVDPKI